VGKRYFKHDPMAADINRCFKDIVLELESVNLRKFVESVERQWHSLGWLSELQWQRLLEIQRGL
jgi:hypothetical protein